MEVFIIGILVRGDKMLDNNKTMVKRCFLTGEYVFFATDRAKRPHSFKRDPVKTTPKEYCPFCPQNSYMTPEPVYDDGLVKIVPNKYPFVHTNEDTYGVHDVVIDTPLHDEKLIDFTDEHIFKLMAVLKNRFIELEGDKKSKYVQIFKNQGMEAGASQSHSHWQIASLPVVPLKMEHLLQVLKGYYDEHKQCYFCNLNFGERIVEENDSFICYIPADGKFPYGMDILPKRHISSIKDFTDKELMDYGIILRNSLKRLIALRPEISYNLCLYSAPRDEKCYNYFHFYTQIIPRIGHMAGFEFSTGCYINSVLPEVGAEELRNAEI